jgi:hypothetical protein
LLAFHLVHFERVHGRRANCESLHAMFDVTTCLNDT